MPEILSRIEAFLERHDMPPSTFGREATGEPQLIKSMRDGRSPSHRVLERIGTFMADYDELHGTASSGLSPDTNPAGIAPATGETERDQAEGPHPCRGSSGRAPAAHEVPSTAAGAFFPEAQP